MLPFLKPKTVAGLIISKRKPDGSTEEQHTEGEEDSQGLDACSADLIRAIHAKDEKAVSAALKAAYEICDSYDEPADDDNSFDAMNIKAAEQAKE